MKRTWRRERLKLPCLCSKRGQAAGTIDSLDEGAIVGRERLEVQGERLQEDQAEVEAREEQQDLAGVRGERVRSVCLDLLMKLLVWR